MRIDLSEKLNTRLLAIDPNGDKSKNDEMDTPDVPINEPRDPTKFPPEEAPPGEHIMPEPPKESPLPDSPPEIVPPKRIVPGEIPPTMTKSYTYL